MHQLLWLLACISAGLVGMENMVDTRRAPRAQVAHTPLFRELWKIVKVIDDKFICPRCQKPLAKGTIASHLRRELNERTYKCDFCEERFNEASQRSRHENTNHKEEIEFSSSLIHASKSMQLNQPVTKKKSDFVTFDKQEDVHHYNTRFSKKQRAAHDTAIEALLELHNQ